MNLVMCLYMNRVFHLLMTVIFNLYILRDLEKYLGWLATASLYLGSGIGGNIVSALFVPYSAEVSIIVFLIVSLICHRLDLQQQCLVSYHSFLCSLLTTGAFSTELL